MDQFQLDPDSETFVAGLVESGRFRSRQDVLRQSVALMRKREADTARFEAEIMKGIDDVKAGRSAPVDEAFDRLDAYIEELAAKKASRSAKTERDKKAA